MFSGRMADMLSAMIYDLCCSKTLLPWTIFELGADIATSRNVYCKVVWVFHFTEVPVKVHFPATLNLDARKFIWSGLKQTVLSKTYQVVRRTKRTVELVLGSTFTMLSSIGNFTSDALSMPEEVPKHLRKLSRNSSILEETNNEFVMVVAPTVFSDSFSYLSPG